MSLPRPSPTGPGSAALFFIVSTALAACGSDPLPPEPPAVPSVVVITPAEVTLTAIDDTQQLSAEVRDQRGNLMPTVPVNWTSIRPSIASVNLTSGLVTATGAGATTITARAGAVSAEATATVRQEARAIEKARGDEQGGFWGEPLVESPAVLVLDANGHPAAEVTVGFEVTSGGGTVSPASVVTGADGIAETAWTLGRDSVQTLAATTGALSVDFRVTAVERGLTIVTDSLDGGRVTLEYAALIETTGGTQQGHAWSLGADSQLPPGLDLSSDGMIHGTPLQVGVSEFEVRVVDSGGEEAAATFGMRVCDGPLGLALGDVRVIEPDDLEPCGFFLRAADADAYYRVTMAGLTASGERLIPVELQVEGISPDRAAALRPVVASDATTAGAAAVVQDPEWARALEIEVANEALHRRIRRQEAELHQRLAAEGRLTGMLERAVEAQAVRRAQAEARGGQRSQAQLTFRLYRREDGADRCVVDRTVAAHVIAENDHMVVYEEESAESPVSVVNANRIIDFYTDHGAEVIERYFGGVSDVNGDGKIVVLVDPALEGVRAYVWSGDMTFLSIDCPTSNEMELVHMSAGAFALDDGRYWAMSGMVHEVKHVSSLYKRVRSDVLRGEPQGQSAFHPTWIEEGTAEIAKEMSSRLAWERAGGPAVGDRVDGDLMRDGLSNARPEVYGTFGLMARVVRAFSVDPNAVTFEPFDEGHVYGSGWHFHRFLRDWRAGPGDAHATDEALVLALNDSLAPPGIAGITAVTGETFSVLLAEHAIATTIAGAEPWLTDDDTPRFIGYDFPMATEIFSNPDPPGRYPWPVTITGEDDDTSVPAAALAQTRSFTGWVGGSGVRVHDFEAMAEGAGAIFHAIVHPLVRVIVARIPKPPGF